MAEADDDVVSHDESGVEEEVEGASPIDTGDFNAAALQMDAESPPTPAPGEEEEQAEPKKTGPSFIIRSLRWLIRWHPFVFLSIALLLAAYAWMVYPEQEERVVPPAESFYYDGLDRLYRVLNPDLPLIASTPADEALAARNALLNLFVFYRNTLRDYPAFVNPHLLLAEANRILAGYNPGMAAKYWDDALSAYNDAGVWEVRDDTPENRAKYIYANFMDNRGRFDQDALLDPANDEIALRKERRMDYINFRRAEASVNLDQPELARNDLEDLRRRDDARRREAVRLTSQEDGLVADVPRHAFELGPDEYRDLDLLLGRVYDGLGDLERARGWYLRYLSTAPAGRSHAFVIERLANISMSDGEVYRKVNRELATRHYESAVEYFKQLIASPSLSRSQYNNAFLGLATANSRLAELVPESDATGIDELSSFGRTIRKALEDFSGQRLPRRTLGIPLAVGRAISRPELVIPSRSAVRVMAAGSLSKMAGGEVTTPHEQRRLYLAEAMEYYDRVAELLTGTPAGEHAVFMAARECWKLGLKSETEARLERMLDPLSSPDLIMAARVGLARVALDRGELRRAHMLILGGYAHPLPVWFDVSDTDWQKFAVQLGIAANRDAPGLWRRLWETIPEEGREISQYAASGRRLDDTYITRFLRNLNSVLRRPDFHNRDDFPPPRDRNKYLTYILDKNRELLTEEDIAWQNRLLFEEALPYDLTKRGSKDNVGYDPLPDTYRLPPGGLIEAPMIRSVLVDLAEAWASASAGALRRSEKARMLLESNDAFQAILDKYPGDPGEVLYELANNYEELAVIRESQGRHIDALSLTAEAGRDYLDVSLKALGSPRERESLLAAGDAFFRAGLLERTVESQLRFLDRFGHSWLPGSEQAMEAVRAENLLGRAYWFLGDSESAIDSFRQNIPRRTPDRYKSIYYIGRVLMEEGVAKDHPELLGIDSAPLPRFNRNGDPEIETALQAFTFLRQSPDINPTARAWRWATFDLAKLRYIFAERARQAAQEANPQPGEARPWLALYETARRNLSEALERYPLRREGGSGVGTSIRVEPEDYADVMTARFETEHMLAQTLLVLAEAGADENLYALSRAHLENLGNRQIYADALFDPVYDRFQLNAAIIREEVDGAAPLSDDERAPLPRTRLGDDEGPSRSPERLTAMLRDGMQLLGNEYFRAGERARERRLLASASMAAGLGTVREEGGEGYYRDSYRVWQDFYDRFGVSYGPQAMVMMGDNLSRMGHSVDSENHYRMARNMTELLPEELRTSGDIAAGAAFWGRIAAERLKDIADGYAVP